jgi:hypothetical protein
VVVGQLGQFDLGVLDPSDVSVAARHRVERGDARGHRPGETVRALIGSFKGCVGRTHRPDLESTRLGARTRLDEHENTLVVELAVLLDLGSDVLPGA